jgi:hypothetical protein
MARKKFEYLTFNRRLLQSEMNQLGFREWGLVTHSAILVAGEIKQYYVFKRELLEEGEKE